MAPLEFEEHQQDSRNKALGAMSNLWSALLTVNGILLALFSALYTATPVGNSLLIQSLIVASVIGCCLMILNFVATRITFTQIAEQLNSERALSPDEEQESIRGARLRHHAIKWSEKAAVSLFVFEVLGTAAFVFSHPAR